MTRIQRKHLVIILILLAAWSLSACQTPDPISFDQVCQPENNQQVITTDGYFSMGATLYCSDTSGDYRCGLVFNSYPDGVQDFSADVKEGNRRNQMKHLDSGYLESDLQIKTDDGSVVGVGEHVTVSGKMLVTEDVCLMLVDKIATFDPAQ
ncbi:hypothetical protein KQH62_03030 [bacterium]|nr:hypothetical protein [bacterium]